MPCRPDFMAEGLCAPITIKKISRSASLGLLCLSLLTATTIPSACSAFPNAKAAGVSSFSFAGSKRISTPGIAAIGMLAGGSPIVGGPAGGTNTQPAFFNVAYSDAQNAGPSSAAWEMATRYLWPANCLTDFAIAFCRSGSSVRGAFSLVNADLRSSRGFLKHR